MDRTIDAFLIQGHLCKSASVQQAHRAQVEDHRDLIESKCLKDIHKDQRNRITQKDDNSIFHSLRVALLDDDEHQYLHEEDGECLSSELPSQALVVNENVEDTKAKCVVHASSSLKCL